MRYVTPDLCDAYPELVRVVEPMFNNFSGVDYFGGVTFNPGEYVYADNNGVIVSSEPLKMPSG